MSRPTRPLVPLALAALVCIPAARGQDLFDPIHLPGGNAPLHVSVGDIDGDGLPDIAATNAAFLLGAGALVYRNVDGFHFDGPTFYSGGNDDILLADVDGDGRADLMQASGGFGDHISVRLANGDGTFGAPTDYTVGQGPADMDAVDLDEDGIVDLAVSSELDVRVSVLIGNGDGTFAPAGYYGPTGDHPRAIAEGDLDGDGHLDIAIANTFDTTVSVLLGNGDGTFGTPLDAYTTGPSPEDIAIADFDEDGDLDVAVVESSTGLLRVIFGDGDGTFSGEVTAPCGSVAEALVAADFDEDGHIDLAGTSGAYDTVSVVLGNGDGTFQPARFFGAGRDPYTLATADFNQDGDLDLVTGNFLGDTLTVMFGAGDGGFSPTHGTGFDPRGTAAADFDGDGLTDLAVTNLTDDTVAVLRNAGGGRMEPLGTFPAGPSPNTVIAIDVTGDAVLDLVVGSETFFVAAVRVLAGQGDGTFGPAVPQEALPSEVRSLAAADLDGNGSVDLAYTRDGNPGLIVAYNNGVGGFPAGVPLSTDTTLEGIDIAEVTGDALPDLIVGRNSFPGEVRVHPNTGSGFGAPVVTVQATSGLFGLDAADLDGDGLVDVVTGTQNSFVTVQLGLGDGTFGPEVIYPAGTSPREITVGDVDGDSLPDIVVANRHSGQENSSVSTLLGAGDGSFTTTPNVTMGKETSNVTVADMDGDGVGDVIASVTGSNHVALLFSRAGPWTVLTKGLAGTHGIPRQTGTGSLQAGAPFVFRLQDALENAFTSHVVGVSALNAPFKGGTMVPFPLLINSGLPIGPDGTLTLAGNWPPGASGATLYLQFWVHDPAGPVGYSASNALAASIP